MRIKNKAIGIGLATLLGILTPVATLAQEEGPKAEYQHSESHGLRVAIGGIGGFTGVRQGSSNPTQATGLDSTRRWSLGAGLLLESPIVDSLGIELGALYIDRKFELRNSNLAIVRHAPTLFIPLEARLWLLDTLSFAGGAFVAFKTGDRTDEIITGNTSAGSFSSNSRQNTEFGTTVAATLNFSTGGKTGLFLEGRYNHGFTNSANDGTFEERIDDLLLMLGLRFDGS